MLSTIADASKPQVHLLRLNENDHLDATRLYELGYIDVAEQAKANQYRDNSARRQFLAGRCLVRTVLAAATQCAMHTIRLHVSPNGKPYVEGSHWQFNLSHSGEFIVCALAPRPIGVDIEACQRQIEHLAIAQQHFSDEEFAWLNKREAHQNQKFTALWSLKEAYLKALGIGISSNLASMQWQLHSRSKLSVRSDLTPHPWFCQLMRPTPQYWLSLCYPERLHAIATNIHSIETLLATEV